MKSIIIRYAKIFAVTSSFLVIIWLNNLSAQVINKTLCKKFLDANELYIINNFSSCFEYKTSNGVAFTFDKIVQENWPKKKIIKINEEAYNQLENVKQNFFISISLFTVYYGDHDRGTFDGVEIKQGKTGPSLSSLYWININLDEMLKGVLSERMIYAVQNLKDILNNYEEKSFRNKELYKTELYKDYLKSNTLYIRKNELNEKLQTPEEIQKIYPYNFKLVSDEECVNAIKEKKDSVLIIEFIRGGHEPKEISYSAIDVYKTNGGKMIIHSYPWMGKDYHLDKKFFEKMF